MVKNAIKRSLDLSSLLCRLYDIIVIFNGGNLDERYNKNRGLNIGRYFITIWSWFGVPITI